jgi:hypothetical protein
MAVLGFLNWLVLSGIHFPDHRNFSKAGGYKPIDEQDNLVDQIEDEQDQHHKQRLQVQQNEVDLKISTKRSTREIISQPLFILSCSVATIGLSVFCVFIVTMTIIFINNYFNFVIKAHTVMVMIMSDCVLSMKGKYSMHKASFAMECHFLAMFVPGFFSGYLIKKFSAFAVSAIGAMIFAMSAVMFALGDELWNYFAGMTLLGLAWNFSYSGATVMLTGCYTVNTLAV